MVTGSILTSLWQQWVVDGVRTRMDVKRLFRKKATAGVPRKGDLCLDLGVAVGMEKRGLNLGICLGTWQA